MTEIRSKMVTAVELSAQEYKRYLKVKKFRDEVHTVLAVKQTDNLLKVSTIKQMKGFSTIIQMETIVLHEAIK